MTIDTPKDSHIHRLRRLLNDAFELPDSFLDLFFSVAYSPERARAAYIDDEPVSALYWFDCECCGERIAYLYAIATDSAHRGCGAASALILDTKEHLRALGYSSAILVPQSQSLFGFYERLGFSKLTEMNEFSALASESPIDIRGLCAEEYFSERKKYLKSGSVTEDMRMIEILAYDAKLYTGEDFILAARCFNDYIIGIELLGNKDRAPDILASLGYKVGIFRTPGRGRDFTMFAPLTYTATLPNYFGIALDI